MKSVFLFLICVFLCAGCDQGKFSIPSLQNEVISEVLARMTDIMVHDVTNPPLASRFFAYTCLAGYEVIARHDKTLTPLQQCLKGYEPVLEPDSVEGYNPKLATIVAMLHTAKKLQPSGFLLSEYESHFFDSCRMLGFKEETIAASNRYGELISKAVLAFARSDRYNKTSTFRRYQPSEKEGTWYPTPPAYFQAVEPYFNTVRPMTLDSASQFAPVPPVPFSSEKHSAFYTLLLQNYHDSLTDTHKEMAAFWDCNPFAMQDNGHLLVGLKKISPGAHWLGITGIVLKDKKASFSRAMQIYTIVAVGLFDGFICCWDEKYRSNRIRPETAIRKYVDETWSPFLQTPPFPEYLSGHSVVSACSAMILSRLLGRQTAFKDTVEMRFGLPSRKFISFNAAAEEAALSRFYGGIHFMDAIEQGLVQGGKVGEEVLSKFIRN